MTFAEDSIMVGSGSQTQTENRWGDYSMMAVDPSDDATFWFTSEYYQTTSSFNWRTRIAAFSLGKELVLDQQRQDGTRLTGTIVGRWNGSSFDSVTITSPPPTINSTVGIREILRGKQELVANPVEKYHVWERNQAAQLDTVQNHRGFTIRHDDQNVTSRFHTTNDATLQAQLIDGGSPGGSLNVKDPWQINLNESPYGYRNRGFDQAVDTLVAYNQNNLGINTNFNGVFLNETPQWDPLKPNYSVGAPNPNYINGIESYFVNWDNATPSQVEFQYPNEQQTGVVFKQSGVTATAKYKAYLASSSSSATGPSSQRKIIRDANGVYHMVYESGNHIWHSMSSDGTNWSGETQLSLDDYGFGTGTNLAPSVTVQPNPHRLLVVWQFSSAGVYWTMFAAVNPSTGLVEGGWQDLNYNYGETTMLPAVAYGVASDGTGYALVAYYTSYAYVYAQVRRSSDGAWVGGATLRSTNPSALTLAPISAPSDFQDTKWHMVWLENGNLLYGSIPIAPTPVLSAPEVVAYGDWEIQSIQNPSVVTIIDGYYRPAVCWEEYDFGLQRRVIKYSERFRTGGWDGPLVFSANPKTPSNYVTPSLSGQYQSQNVAVVWRSGSSQLKDALRNAYAWTPQTNLATGVDPSASVGWYGTGMEKVLSRTAGSALYTIQRHTLTYGGQQNASVKKESPLASSGTADEARGGRVVVRRGTLQLLIRQPMLNGAPIPFVTLNDSVPLPDERALEVAVRTEPFTGTGRLRAQLMYAAAGELPAGALFRLVLRDAATDKALATVRIFRGTRDSITIDQSLHFANRQLRLGIELQGTTQSRAYRVERWNIAPEDTSSMQSLQRARSEETAARTSIPYSYALHAAYPNPFNPSTTINYDLPEAAQVSLVVYDVLGRKVAELVNGYREAGYHNVQWSTDNGLRKESFGQLSSGVYFARFTATDASGNLKFSKVNKLLLTK
jgi:hypothetical protein